MKRLLLIQLFWLAVLAWPVQSQELPTLSDLQVSLQPEFDRPEMLVIYRGQFEADTPLPVPVEISIPTSVGAPSAVAYADEEGGLFNQEYTTRIEGDWLVVAFELGVQAFQVEYYDPLARQAGRREYEVAFVADYPIDTLRLDVQVPPTAEQFVLEPAADAVTLEDDGLLYHRSQIDSVAQGETLGWTISYQKADDDLTLTGFTSPQASAVAPAPAAQERDQSIVWVFLIAFFCLVAVGAAAFWLGRRAQPPPPPAAATKRRGSGRGARTDRLALSAFPGDESFHCHQCGALLRSDSAFCHKCGTPVREQ